MFGKSTPAPDGYAPLVQQPDLAVPVKKPDVEAPAVTEPVPASAEPVPTPVPENGQAPVPETAEQFTTLPPPTASADVVQFIESVAIVSSDERVDSTCCNAGQAQIDIPIMRVGPCVGECEFSWSTEGGSALPGKEFVQSSGVVTMKDGEHSVFVTVPILSDPNWHTSKEFSVVLDNPKNCDLGLYMRVTRVKVINTNAFPSNKFKGKVNPMSPDIIGFGLYVEFMKFALLQSGVGCRIFMTIIFDLLKLVYLYVSLFVYVYTVDKLFNLSFEADNLYISGKRVYTAYALGLVFVGPQLLFFVSDYVESKMSLQALMRFEITKSLFSKIMDYSLKARGETPLPLMVSVFTQKVDKVCYGYTSARNWLRCMAQFAVLLFFIIQQQPTMSKNFYAVVCGVPCVMFLWVLLRLRVSIQTSEAVNERESLVSSFVSMALSNITLIGAYRQRPHMTANFVNYVSELANQTYSSYKVMFNNQGFPRLLSPVLVAVYIFYGATSVASSSLSLGAFLATIKAISSICETAAEANGEITNIISTFPALKVLTELLNKESVFIKMKDASKVADEKTKDALAGMPAEPQDIPRSDRLKIELSDVQFEYDIIKGGMPELFPVFKNLKFTATQGQIIGVKGKSGSGRKTFLDLVSGTLYPTGGNIFVPLHLRKLLITPEIYLLDLSIWANLTFGSTEVDPYRLEKILKHFEMDAVLNDEQFQRDLTSRKVAFDSQGAVMVVELEEVSKTTNVLVKFREGYQALIHLIRGFLTNPEVMVMHRPFVHFHEGPIMEQVEEAIMETKEDRGFMMPEENVLSRRPRTIIMSLDNADTHESMTDVTWYLPDQIGGECVQKDAAARKGVGGFIPGSHLVLSSSQRGSKTAQARKAAADAQAPGSLQSLTGTVTSFVPASLMI